ncbi:MAG: hypothetical protein QCH35_02585 [Methanomicrobiaceae archaeon]|nr:hypothetical protein [Methanomicrobiaceae archaeon]
MAINLSIPRTQYIIGLQSLRIVRWFSPFVIIGYLAAKNYENIVNNKYIYPLATMIFILLLPSWTGYAPKGFINFGIIPLIIDFILSIAGIIVAWGLMRSLAKTPIDKLLKFYGIYSLEIYLVSNFVALILIQIEHVQFWIDQGMTAYITGTIVYLLISLILAVLLSYNKYVSLLLFGKWSWKIFNEQFRIPKFSLPNFSSAPKNN